MTRRWWMLLLPLGGILTALCLVFPVVGGLQWFTMVPALLFFLSRAERGGMKLRVAYGFGFLYFLSFYLLIYHWFFALYPMEFAGISTGEAALLVVICWLGLSLLQTVFSALLFPLYARLSRTRPAQRFPLLAPILFAALYTVFEWSQTLTWMGVPWARLALGQEKCGILFNSAAILGPYAITFALVCVNALVAYALLHADRARATAWVAVAFFAAHTAVGALGYLTAAPTRGEALVAAAVQGNVGSSGKWDSDGRTTFDIYEQYTAKAAEAGATLVVFPETFWPYTLREDTPFGDFVSDLAIRYDVTIVCGAFHEDDEGNSYNAIFAVLPDGSISDRVYAKQRLVPFGEFVPMRPVVEFLVPPLADIGMLSEDLTKGTSSAPLPTDKGQIGALVCFDSIYENLTAATVREGAGLICLSTNDSWFTDSAAVRMHHAQARLRAIESGRWIVRSADTGISSIISPTGKSFDEQPPLCEGVSIATVYVRDTRTVYSYIGNLLVYLLMAGITVFTVDGIVCAVRARRQAKK